MSTREIDYKYLESLPTLLEIRDIGTERTKLYQDLVIKNLLQPSFVTRVHITGNPVRFTLLLPLRLALQITCHNSDRRTLSVSEASTCCLQSLDYSQRCSNCKEPRHIGGEKLREFNVCPKLSLIPKDEQTEGESYDTGEDKFLFEVAQVLQDRDIDSFNALLIAGELWHITWALGMMSE